MRGEDDASRSGVETADDICELITSSSRRGARPRLGFDVLREQSHLGEQKFALFLVSLGARVTKSVAFLLSYVGDHLIAIDEFLGGEGPPEHLGREKFDR